MEHYTRLVELTAGEKYDFILETENRSTGAARLRLFWKTPAMFAREQSKIDREKSRQIYLPAGRNWYDFWTGEVTSGGRQIKTAAPIDLIPLFVKAGSIIPLGPFLQFSTEKPADPLELRIYPGADADFTLYEDENDNYNYEKGIYATIEFNWNDAQRQLTISARKGEFPAMLKKRTINVVLVSKDHGTGLAISARTDRSVLYEGKAITIHL